MKKEITVPGNNQELLPITQSQSSFALNDETARERETLVESTPISGKLEASNGKRDEDGDEPSIVTEMVPPHSKDNNDKGGCKLHLPDGIKLASDGPNADTKDRNHAEFLSSSPGRSRGMAAYVEGRSKNWTIESGCQCHQQL